MLEFCVGVKIDAEAAKTWIYPGKIVFASPSRELVMQQIEACHKIVGIPQEWTIDLTGGMLRRAEFWKCKCVFFVSPQALEKDIQSGSCLVKNLVCLVIDEAHRATGNYSYCGAIREGYDKGSYQLVLSSYVLMKRFNNNGKSVWGSSRPDVFSRRQQPVGCRDFGNYNCRPFDDGEMENRPGEGSHHDDPVSLKLDRLLDRLDKLIAWRDKTDRRFENLEPAWSRYTEPPLGYEYGEDFDDEDFRQQKPWEMGYRQSRNQSNGYDQSVDRPPSCWDPHQRFQIAGVVSVPQFLEPELRFLQMPIGDVPRGVSEGVNQEPMRHPIRMKAPKSIGKERVGSSSSVTSPDSSETREANRATMYQVLQRALYADTSTMNPDVHWKMILGLQKDLCL
ncbi:hypothetical protein SASPL_100148 [Salvia splendens]|uniref:Helicase ATP-binding domain-containing protein n=1 Tax=Salvia splendens TaxID=180675 RepID=A0A8X8YLT6_SALSN|nr:hypothetical protein SASPL_100148 [Salvia splendens]